LRVAFAYLSDNGGVLSLILRAATRVGPLITLTLPAMPVARALVEISRQSGIPLTASPDTKFEMVCMRLKGAPADQAMAKLAFCLHATWEKRGNGFQLIRTDRQKQDERDEDQAPSGTDQAGTRLQ
jgi:hypothetical protein